MRRRERKSTVGAPQSSRRGQQRSFGRNDRGKTHNIAALSHGRERNSLANGGGRAKEKNSAEDTSFQEEGGSFIRRAGRSDGEPDSVERAPRPGCVSTPHLNSNLS